MITVVNKRFHIPTAHDFPVHRPYPLGNPYSHKDDTLALYKVNSIEEAIEKFEEHFKNIILSDKGVQRNIRLILEHHAKYGKVNLVCYCVSKHNSKCHAQFIKQCLDAYITQT